MDYNTQYANQEREYNWDDTIQKDNEFILLPEGDYDFVVESFQRGRFNGSDKMPACPMAQIKVKIINPSGDNVTVDVSLLLHSRVEWKLSEFFAGIGQKKKGEPLRMNWNYVPGSKGRCKVGLRTYKDNQYNEIKKFYPKDPSYGSSNAAPSFTNGQF